MTIAYSTAVAAARLQKVIDGVDAGAGFGLLVIGTSALSGATGVLASFTLQKPSATISVRTLTIAGSPLLAVASASGIAAKAELRTSAGTVIASGLSIGLTGSGSDIIIDTTGVVSGRNVYLLAGTIVHP